jgi:hypothetical protein
MRSVVLASSVILLTGGAFVLSGNPQNFEQFKLSSLPAAEPARIETARLFNASPERYDFTHSITADQAPQQQTVSWPEVSKPKLKKRTVAASDARNRPAQERKPVTRKQAPKKLPSR